MAKDWTPPTPPGWDYPTLGEADEDEEATPSRIDRVNLWALGDIGPAKVRLLVKRVIQPALRDNLGWTRGVLAEALRGAPGGVNGHDKRALAVRIFEYVRYRMRYVNDPKGREMFTALPVAWGRGIGDCDDFSALMAALLMAAGIPVKLRVIKGLRAEGWSHIYPMAWLQGRGNTPPEWRALDATTNHPAGWEAEKRDFFDTEVTP